MIVPDRRRKTAEPRVFFVSRSYPPVRGGMELHNARIHESLTNHLTIRAIVNPYGKRLLIPFLALAWVRLLVELRPGDRVLFGDLLTAGLAPWLRPFHRRSTWVSVAHGTDTVWWPRPYQRWLKSRVLPALARIIAVSHATARAVEQRGAEPSRVVVVGNGTDGIPLQERATARARVRDTFGADLSKHRTILALGRLVPRKGLAWFAEHVVPQLPEDALVLIGGEGPDRTTIESTIRRLNLGSRVQLLGTVTDSERAMLYNAADVFVMPNRTIPGDMEGFGITLLEALSVALPVVATDTEGIRDAARHGALARLVPPDAPSVFAAAVCAALAYPVPSESARRDTHLAVLEEHSWAAVAERYAAILGAPENADGHRGSGNTAAQG